VTTDVRTFKLTIRGGWIEAVSRDVGRNGDEGLDDPLLGWEGTGVSGGRVGGGDLKDVGVGREAEAQLPGRNLHEFLYFVLIFVHSHPFLLALRAVAFEDRPKGRLRIGGTGTIVVLEVVDRRPGHAERVARCGRGFQDTSSWGFGCNTDGAGDILRVGRETVGWLGVVGAQEIGAGGEGCRIGDRIYLNRGPNVGLGLDSGNRASDGLLDLLGGLSSIQSQDPCGLAPDDPGVSRINLGWLLVGLKDPRMGVIEVLKRTG